MAGCVDTRRTLQGTRVQAPYQDLLANKVGQGLKRRHGEAPEQVLLRGKADAGSEPVLGRWAGFSGRTSVASPAHQIRDASGQAQHMRGFIEIRQSRVEARMGFSGRTGMNRTASGIQQQFHVYGPLCHSGGAVPEAVLGAGPSVGLDSPVTLGVLSCSLLRPFHISNGTGNR